MSSAVVKSASHEPARARLRHEAQILQRARHPGVVSLASCVDDAGVTRLTFTESTVTTLADTPPTDPVAALRFAAALARTVADLHEIGIAHRRLRADHVLVTSAGRPMLCGFADATDHATDDDRRADDLALRDLIELVAVSGASTGRRTRAARALRGLATGPRGNATPMTAAELAGRAGRAATRADRAAHSRAVLARTRALRHAAAPRRLAAFALGPAVVIATVVGLTRHAGDPSTPASPGVDANTTGLAPAGVAPVRITAGGSQYDVGTTGDQVVIADWTCTGEPSVALLRPATGDVYLFSTFPVAGETATGRHVGSVTGAAELVTDVADRACPPLVVKRHDGTTHEIGAR